ncbi:cupin domain-containing protein [Ktedonosporobacter rubrisoli]|uniref:Cupin domain-containing protein n=1 Tax=Ktedonosporobacter rubrisoli TaxID=2509675 RepID=A0A4P6JWU4_KTERU|nr:cupin domain-containing protein [Ktedonosporobacter rubrisoli]QBD79863.1 cupin domain-containing protein [Ktedonosporobacter rubrisoli]
MTSIISKESLRWNENACLFQGSEHGDVPVSFFWMTSVPGSGPNLHKHPYPEVFIMLQGKATFTLGDTTLDVHSEEVVIAPPNTPHGFKNTGEEPLLLVSIHPNKQVIQEWLEK